jgi:hypothetical protein
MLTTTTTNRTLGDRLAADLRRARLRRKTRPRTKRRTTKRSAKPLTDPRVSAFKRDLERTPNGRRTLQLVGEVAQARLIEEVAQCGLDDAVASERKLQERLCALAPLDTAEAYRSAAELQGDLIDAEHELRRWRGEYQRHHHERERLEAEIQHLAGYL